MLFKEIILKALAVRAAYEAYEKKKFGKNWSRENIAQGFVGDVGDLMKLVMAKEGLRKIDDVDEKLRHELSDCLWSIIVLADKYNIDLEQAFIENMAKLKKDIESKSS
jgi:NTP pyrophosphatase (non-canonical NTP hydrolase)